MQRLINSISVFAFVGLMMFGIAGQADAQRRNEREVRDIVRSLNSKIDDFQFGLDYQMKSGSANRQDIDDVEDKIGNLQSKVDAFDENFRQRRENRDDVSEIVTAAKDIDSFLTRNTQNRRVQNDWSGVRDLINRLSSSYGFVPDWNSRTSSYPAASRDNDSLPPVSSPVSYGLTGTYTLDSARSENTNDIISRSNVGNAQRQELESKLDAPEEIALHVRGNQVTLASSKAAPVTFVADGRDKTEQSGGRTVKLRATLRGQDLTLTSLGGETDYTVTFSSADSGKSLKVTRRITTDYLRETVFAESFYNKTDAVAKLGIDGNSTVGSNDDGTFSSNDPNDRPGSTSQDPTVNQGRTGDYVVPNGTIITGVLENEINTKVSQNNDRFKMTVQSPDEFRGATVEGYISGVGRSGQVSGRSNVTFNFERITLRDGKTYDFAGFLQSVKDQNGKVVKVDSEGTAKSDSQTKETAVRGGIGAGLGAIIGAIAGGGKGAAIGAILGGGAGAGSVVLQGREDIQLLKGSMITVQASSPNRGDRVSEN